MLNRISFKSQITLLAVSLLLLTILVLSTTNWLKTAHYIELQLNRQINFTQNVVEQTLSQQEQVLSTAATVLAADFGFKQAVASGDKSTIDSVLLNHGRRIKANLMMLVDLDGKLVTSSLENVYSLTDTQSDIRQLPLRDLHGQILTINKRVFQVIVVPVKAPRTIAYTIIGFEFNQQALENLKELVSLDITLLNNKNIINSTLSMELHTELLTFIEAEEQDNLIFTSANYFHQPIDIKSLGNVPMVLSASLKEIHQDFRQLLLTTLLAAFSILLIAIACSHILSTRLNLPLERLLRLTKSISEGQFKFPKVKKQQLPTEFNELYAGFSLMSSAIEQRERAITYQAERDVLTGLLNRYKLLEGIKQLLLKEVEVALVNINFKGFKKLNDTIGINNGDKILIETAERLTLLCNKHQSPKNILLSRTNADEFIVALKINQTDEIEYFLGLLQTELERPIWLEGIQLSPNLYYGLANSLEHGKDSEKLLRRATMAAAKALSEQVTVRTYQQGEDEAYLYKLHLIEELKIALESDNSPLFLNYQPKLNLLNNDVDKLEALIRWINKDGEFVNPEVFVSLAEESGLIVTLTQWVIDNVCRQVKNWSDRGQQFNVSINLSAQDIQHEQFVGFLLDTVAQHQVKPQQIILELTERDIAENEQLVIARLTHLKSLGFQISVDDYGIGQSSLAKLKNLPVDELKIDKCFILKLDRSEQDQHIVASTIALGHKLGLRVVAEGVENAESLALLRQFNCDYIQGYYLSRPLKAQALIDWFTNDEKIS